MITSPRPFTAIPATAGRPKSPFKAALETLPVGHFMQASFGNTKQRRSMASNLSIFNRKHGTKIVARTIDHQTVQFYRLA